MASIILDSSPPEAIRVSGPNGEWRITVLPAGEYVLTFELDGFKKLARSGVNVEAKLLMLEHAFVHQGGPPEGPGQGRLLDRQPIGRLLEVVAVEMGDVDRVEQIGVARKAELLSDGEWHDGLLLDLLREELL